MSQGRDPRSPRGPSFPPGAGRPAQPEPEPEPLILDESALLELPMDAMVPAEIDTDSEAPIALDASMLEPVEQIEQMEGLELTHHEERAPRPKKSPDAPSARKALRPDFVYASCPGCGAAQPDPAPAFCEACGQRLRKPGAKRADGKAVESDAMKRCGECGFRNREELKSCTNCGSRI